MQHDDSPRIGVDGSSSWTLTASGLKLYYLNPEVDAICLADIAQHLSMICRFTGATSQFYSVAQHSVFVAQMVKQVLDDICVDNQTVDYWDQILAALFHDAEETYTQDIASPLKACIGGKYRWIASGISRKIFERYGIDWEYHNALLKSCDNTACIVERFYLMPVHADWPMVAAEEMRYAKPRLMEHDEAKIIFTQTVRAALKVRGALLDEACS